MFSNAPPTVWYELRRLDASSGKVVAYADVILSLDARGSVRLSGFSVFTASSGALRVASPARKGTQRYFDIVTLHGPIRQQIERAVLDEYQRQCAAAG